MCCSGNLDKCVCSCKHYPSHDIEHFHHSKTYPHFSFQFFSITIFLSLSPQIRFFFLIIYFIYLFLAELGLCGCTRAFSSCGERGLLFVVVRRLLTAVASLVAEHGLQARGLQQLQHAGSVVVAHRLSCSTVCGIFPDQGSNPCPLHWQADSQPLRHQGSPIDQLLSVLELRINKIIQYIVFYVSFYC